MLLILMVSYYKLLFYYIKNSFFNRKIKQKFQLLMLQINYFVVQISEKETENFCHMASVDTKGKEDLCKYNQTTTL